jgi:tripartite-type tricarboxylate transporter receptor subunit TctC
MNRRGSSPSRFSFPWRSAPKADIPSGRSTWSCPSPRGGDGDIIAALWTKYATPLLGGNVVLENKAGAGGAIGATEVARARRRLYAPGRPYDPIRDFMLIIRATGFRIQ